MKQFIHSFESEWLKRRRSLASWLVVCGAFFTPTLIIAAKVYRHSSLKLAYSSPTYWENQWKISWESMAVFLLPVGTILATSLITQLEYKNNSWKLVHTTPQRFSTIFLAKLSVILVMMLQFLVLFNVGIYISGIIPGLLFGVPYPKATLPFNYFLIENTRYFLACLPIIALQYLISLRFKNFLVPVGVGFALWILSIGMLPWKFSFIIPYTYTSLNYLKGNTKISHTVAMEPWAFGYFVVFIVSAYILYLQQKEKG